MCAVEGCNRIARCRGWCNAHYCRYYTYGDPLSGKRPIRPLAEADCSVGECAKPAVVKGWCYSHYDRYRKYGDVRADQPIRVSERDPAIGARWVDEKSGYVWLRVSRGRRGLRHEHRVVLEQALGRSLLRTEEVHHRNGVRDDNRLENLELWVHSQPAGQRVDDVIAHAVEMLDRYAPHMLSERDVSR